MKSKTTVSCLTAGRYMAMAEFCDLARCAAPQVIAKAKELNLVLGVLFNDYTVISKAHSELLLDSLNPDPSYIPSSERRYYKNQLVGRKS